eukprot:GHVS01023969.1.p1 GENE.GHVS01023969.1~~GHVS01023969.1.p1  ORF type:complete len:125 (+),score=15.73 GHVS01023969.1:192-566(+)
MRKTNDFTDESFSLYNPSSPNAEDRPIERSLTGHIEDSDVDVYFLGKEQCGKNSGCRDKEALVLQLAMTGKEARVKVNLRMKSWIRIGEKTPFSVTTLTDERNDLRLINVVDKGVKKKKMGASI